MPMEKHRYPPEWKKIALEVKEAADWRCAEVSCGTQKTKDGRRRGVNDYGGGYSAVRHLVGDMFSDVLWGVRNHDAINARTDRVYTRRETPGN